jgi:hypothetical protein
MLPKCVGLAEVGGAIQAAVVVAAAGDDATDGRGRGSLLPVAGNPAVAVDEAEVGGLDARGTIRQVADPGAVDQLLALGR